MLNTGITLTNLTLSYQRHPAVHHLSGVFKRGTTTAIMGPNGGGKSTLIRSLAGLHPIDEGSIERPDDLCLAATAFLPQSLTWDRQFPLSVFDLAAQALIPELGFWKRINKLQMERVNAALEQVGLIERKNHSIGTLSLGQFQRALFARVIVQEAQVILLDEPLTGLDEKSCHKILELIHQWHQGGKTLIVVLHDRQIAIDHFQTTLILSQEVQAWGPSAEVLVPQIWGQALLHNPIPTSIEECER